jgi:hypothetical protein
MHADPSWPQDGAGYVNEGHTTEQTSPAGRQTNPAADEPIPPAATAWTAYAGMTAFVNSRGHCCDADRNSVLVDDATFFPQVSRIVPDIMNRELA